MEIDFELERNGKLLRGTIHRPQSSAAKQPCLIFCHGFTGSRNEAHNLFVKTARAVEKAGIVCIRFDFLGSGESDGEFLDTTVSGQTDDCLEVYRFASTLEYVDPRKIYLLGHSMGSLVAIMANVHLNGSVARTVLLSTAVTILHELIAPLTGSKLDECLTHGTIDYWGNVAGVTLLHDVCMENYFSRASGMSGKVLLLHGTEDHDSPTYNSVLLKEILSDRAQLSLIRGADHCYTAAPFEKQVIDKILGFLVNS